MMEAIVGVPKVKLICSEEFAVTNPYKLSNRKASLTHSGKLFHHQIPDIITHELH
jgi:hypothetical protein